MHDQKTADDRKTSVIILRLTPTEKQKATEIATESGATVSGLIRELLKKSKVRR